jgi:hypothetical protein
VDLTLTTITPATHGKPAMKTGEVIHTNQKHPFLSREKGFLSVGQIKLGMYVLRADGTYGVVTGRKMIPGTKVMYNLEVAQDHTYTVGAGQWVGHNHCGPGGSGEGFADQILLDDHFGRHSGEFVPEYGYGYTDANAYEQGAVDFMRGSSPSGTYGSVLLRVRANGDIVRFNPITNEFGVARSDGVIRTYYIPVRNSRECDMGCMTAGPWTA